MKAPVFGLQGMRARLVRGVAWNFVATAFTQGATFALSVILANLWGGRLFGQYALLQNTSALLTSLAQTFTSSTATKYVAELRSIDTARAGRMLGLTTWVAVGAALLAAALITLGGGLIARVVFDDASLAGPLRLLAAVVSLNILSSTATGALAGFERFDALARTALVTSVVLVGSCAIGAARYGLPGAIGGLTVGAALQAGALWRVLYAAAKRAGIRVDLAGAGAELGALSRFVAPAALNGFVSYPCVWFATTLLVRHPDGYQQAGWYSAANSLRTLVVLVPGIVGGVTLALLNHSRGTAGIEGYRKVFLSSVAVNVAVAALGSVVVWGSGSWLLGAFGAEFRMAYPALAILMLSTVPETFAIAAVQLAQSQERGWLSLLVVIVPCYGSLAVLSLVLSPWLGARGLAIAYTVAMTLGALLAAGMVASIGLSRGGETSAAHG